MAIQKQAYLNTLDSWSFDHERVFADGGIRRVLFVNDSGFRFGGFMTLGEAVLKTGRYKDIPEFCKRFGVSERTMYDWWKNRRSVVEGLLRVE